MTRKVNKTAIGGFVVGALAIAVIAVLIFGGGKFLTDTQKCVFNFEGSVDGLGVGAPIVLKGVKIGTVTRIQIVFNQKTMNFRTEVLGETYGNIQPDDPDLMHKMMEERGMTEMELRAFFIRELVDKHGLRAQLKVQSMITGMLMVSLDFHPDTPIKRFGVNQFGLGESYEEIPTIPMVMEDIANKISEIPLPQILNDLQKTLAGIERIVNSTKLKDSIAKLDDMVGGLNTLIDHLNENFEPMRNDVKKTLNAAHAMLTDTRERIIPLAKNMDAAVKETRDLVRNVNERVGPVTSSIGEAMDDARQLVRKIDTQLIDDLKGTIDSAKSAMERANSSLSQLEKGFISPQSPMYHELIKTLEKLSEAMASVHEMTAYLERHPEALLKGKQGE